MCPQNHSFDLSRSGYVNLLQPQDKRSKRPGDSVEAVAARRRLHDAGVTKPLLNSVEELVGTRPSDKVLDAGCGEGFYLGSLRHRVGFAGCGVDISIPAIDAAAKRYGDCTWIVGNADRFFPFGDGSFTKVLSITARMNPAEFRRVLQPHGMLLLALPAPDDLIELRGAGRDRITRSLAEFASCFELVAQRRASTSAALDAASVADVLKSIYRPMQAEEPRAMTVTFSLDLLLLRRI